MNKKADHPDNRSQKEAGTNKKTSQLPYDPSITEEDKQALQDRNLSMDQHQDKALSDRNRPVDFTAKDLDIPGSDDRDTSHKSSELPDEENFQFNRRGEQPDEAGTESHPEREGNNNP